MKIKDILTLNPSEDIKNVIDLEDISEKEIKTEIENYIVTDGLAAGDRIAMGGTSLLKNGSQITPKPSDWKPGKSTTNVAK